MPRIVVLHDDDVIREMLCHLLMSAGYTAAGSSTDTAAALIRRAPRTC